VCRYISAVSDEGIPAYTVPDGVDVVAGLYVVGETLPEGSYTVAFNGKEETRVRLYRNLEDMEYMNLNVKVDITLSRYNVQGALTLRNGMVVLI